MESTVAHVCMCVYPYVCVSVLPLDESCHTHVCVYCCGITCGWNTAQQWYIYIYICIYIYTCKYICIHIHIYICILYMYTYTHVYVYRTNMCWISLLTSSLLSHVRARVFLIRVSIIIVWVFCVERTLYDSFHRKWYPFEKSTKSRNPNPWYKFKLNPNLNLNLYHEIPRNLSSSIWWNLGGADFSAEKCCTVCVRASLG